jgi:hypothetical protein
MAIAMKVKNRIRIAKAQNVIQNVNNYGIMYNISRKTKKTIVLIACNILIWWAVGSIALTPRVIIIENAQASVLSVQADSPVANIEGSQEHGETAQAQTPQLSIEDKILKAFDGDQEMLSIARAESRLNPMAHNKNRNGTIDTGIFQINSCHGYDEKWLQDPDNNIIAAKEILKKQGKQAWVTFNFAKRNNLEI